MSDTQNFVHRIDEDDSIAYLNENWLEFAVANDAPHLTEEAVVGRCLWDFITDDTTAHLYQVIVAKVRDTLTAIEVPYRCDAPGSRRRMLMTISPLPGGEVEFSSVIESMEDREPVPILNALIFRSEDHIRMCSWCKSVETGQGWVPTEDGVKALGLFRTPRLPAISHAICEKCNDRMRSDPLFG